MCCRQFGSYSSVNRIEAAAFCSIQHLPLGSTQANFLDSPSEQAANGDEDLAAAGVADRGADGDSSEGCGGNQSRGSILAQNRSLRWRPDFAGLVADDAVEALAQAGGERGEAVQIARAGQIGVSAAILAEGGSREAAGTAEGEAVRLGDVGAQVGVDIRGQTEDVAFPPKPCVRGGEHSQRGIAASGGMIKRAGRRRETESLGRNGAGGLLVDVDVQEAGLRGS